jgi:hypothetical protein
MISIRHHWEASAYSLKFIVNYAHVMQQTSQSWEVGNIFKNRHVEMFSEKRVQLDRSV